MNWYWESTGQSLYLSEGPDYTLLGAYTFATMP